MSEPVDLYVIVALVSILGSIGSVLLLAFRVGRITGVYQERANATDREVHANTNAIDRLRDALTNHIGTPHRG